MKIHELFKLKMNHIETSCLTETNGVYVYYNLIIIVVL